MLIFSILNFARATCLVVQIIQTFCFKVLAEFKSLVNLIHLYSTSTANLYGTGWLVINKMSRDMRFLTMWYVRPAKPQISLHIRAVKSEPLLVA